MTMSRAPNAPWSRSSPAVSPPSTRAPRRSAVPTGFGSPRRPAARPPTAVLDAGAWRLRARVLDYDDLRRAAAASAHLHRVGHADRARDRRRGSLRTHAVSHRRAVERLVPHAAWAQAAVHARRD